MLLLLCAPALAASFTVPTDGTLQEVVFAAAAGDDITILADWVTASTAVLKITRTVTITGDAAGPASLPPVSISGGATVSLSNVVFPWVAAQDAAQYKSSPTDTGTAGQVQIAIRVSGASASLTNVVSSDTAGLGVYAEDSELTAVDSAFDNHSGHPGAYFVSTTGAHVFSLSGGTVQGNDYSALIGMETGAGRASVNVNGTAFMNNGLGSGESVGYGLWLSGADGAFTDSTFEDTEWGTTAITVYSSGGALTFKDVTFKNVGGAGSLLVDVIGTDASLNMTRVTMSWPDVTSDLYGAVQATDCGDVTIDGLRIDGANCESSPIHIDDVTGSTMSDLFVANSSGAGAGALYFQGDSMLTLTRARLCSNTGTQGFSAGAIEVVGKATLTGSILASNSGASGIIHLEGGTFDILNADFVGNSSNVGTLYSPVASVAWSAENTIFTDEVLAVGAIAATVLTANYNLWHGNGSDGVFGYTSDDVTRDPAFVSSWDPTDCDTYPELDAGSPAIDAGNGSPDADGSPYDIGAMSGPAPILAPLVAGDDVDGDGHESLESGGDDCDDTNASVHPGASEIAYDGVDQDCSGQDLVDIDGDGYDGTEAGGDDCDDTDSEVGPCDTGPYDTDTAPVVGVDADGDGHDSIASGGDDCDDESPGEYPGHWDDPATPADEDCDGSNARVTLAGSCGCSANRSGPNGVEWLYGLVAIAIVVGRARRAVEIG